MIACEEDKEDIVKLLIENRASVALKNKVSISVKVSLMCISITVNDHCKT